MSYGLPQNLPPPGFLGMGNGTLGLSNDPMAAMMPQQVQAQLQAMPMPKIDANTPSPYGHAGDVINQYVASKQQQQPPGLIQQIFAQRFQPTGEDIGRSAMLTAVNNKYVSPNEMAQQRMGNELAPYTTMLGLREQINKVNAPQSDYGKLMTDVNSGLIPSSMAEQAMGKIGLDQRLKEAQIQSLLSLANKNNASAAGGNMNAPAGYRYSTDKKSLEAIPGGPATKLPGNEAAQLAMLNIGLENMPKIREIFGKSFNNLFNGPDWQMGRGDVGNAKRMVTAGVEAALRAMSGAAVPKEEVERYSELFMPTPIDGLQTRTNKLNELEKFMSHASVNMGKGRTAGDSAILNQTAPEPDYSGMTDSEILRELNQ